MIPNNRTCLNCGSATTNINKKGNPNWFKFKNGYVCSKCYSKLIHYPKYYKKNKEKLREYSRENMRKHPHACYKRTIDREKRYSELLEIEFAQDRERLKKSGELTDTSLVSQLRPIKKREKERM